MHLPFGIPPINTSGEFALMLAAVVYSLDRAARVGNFIVERVIAYLALRRFRKSMENFKDSLTALQDVFQIRKDS